MMKNLSTIIMMAATVFCAHGEFKLAENGKVFARIELSSEAAPPEQLAKRELEAYLTKITGGTFEKQQIGTIFIGTIENLKNLSQDIVGKIRNSGSKEAFVISILPGKILIVGASPIGALFGTYTFIEKHLGVRWFYAGEMGEYCPFKKTIVIADSEELQKPAYFERNLNLVSSSNDFQSTCEWMVRNKMNLTRRNAMDYQLQSTIKSPEERQLFREERGKLWSTGDHDFFVKGIPVTLFKEHPEYFVLKDGVRTCKGRVDRCFSNPKVQELCADYLRQSYKKNPNVRLLFCGDDAADSYCQCEACREMGSVNGKFSVTDLYHRFYSKVLNMILAETPEAAAEVNAYWTYRPVPNAPEIHYYGKNVRVTVATHQKCYAHHFTKGSPCNKDIFKLLEEWGKRADHLGIYDYYADANTFYAPFEFVLADELKTYRKLKVITWEDESTATYKAYKHLQKTEKEYSYHYLSMWQMRYVAAKLLWDTSLDVEIILDEAYTLYYGKVSDVMKKYHAFRRELWESAPGCCFLNGPNRSAYCLNVPGAEAKLDGYLTEALRKADTEIVKKRIEQDCLLLEMFWKEPNRELKKRLASTKEITPQACEDKIVIDGNFTEKTWLKAKVIDDFINPSTKQVAKEKTQVRVAYDNENLYIAVNADNSSGERPLTAKCTERDDGNIFKDDSIEIQIVPPDRDGKLYHFAINTLGTLYDAECVGQNFNRAFDSNAEVKVSQKDKVFNYEIRIPLAALKITTSSVHVWKMHFMRTVTNLLPPTSYEWSSIDGVLPFKEDLFRKTVFAKNLIPNSNFAEIVSEYKPSGVKVEKAFPFPKYWGVAGGAIQNHKIIAGSNGNRIEYRGGCIFIMFRVPKDLQKNKEYNFVVRAKGKGKISCSSWSWAGTVPPWKDHRREKLGEKTLSDEFKDYIFKSKALDSESHYVLYIYGTDQIIVESVFGMVLDN